jgi:hypothetical protein
MLKYVYARANSFENNINLQQVQKPKSDSQASKTGEKQLVCIREYEKKVSLQISDREAD